MYRRRNMLERIVSVTAPARLPESDGCVLIGSEAANGANSKIHLRRKPAVSHPENDRGSGAHGAETVLVAEDDRAVRKLMTKALRLRGYQTLTAADGLEALQFAEHHPGRIDALITDVDMPRLGGIELAVQLTGIR